MFKWKNLGKVFDPNEIESKVWLNELIQTPSVLIYNNIVRVYFSCRSLQDKNGQYVYYSAYFDLKRENLFEIISVSKTPFLKLGNSGTFDEFGTCPVSVIRKGKDILAYYGGLTRCESTPYNMAIGLAISIDDGNQYTKMGDGPLLSYSTDEPFILSDPKIRIFNNNFYLFYISGRKWIMDKGNPDPVLKIRMAKSYDGIDWEKLNLDIVANKHNEDEVQESPDLFFYNGKYHMFFCYRYNSGFTIGSKDHHIGYASSSDLINWYRDDAKAGISTLEEQLKSERICFPHVFELDGSIFMFYLMHLDGKNCLGIAELDNNKSFID